MELLVKMSGVTKSFSGVRVLNAVNLEVRRGEVHALVGENGAGKSTLIKILSGAIPRDSGEIWFDGTRFEPTSPAEARTRGIATIYQELALVPEFSVARNIFLGREPVVRGLIGWRQMRQQSRQILDRLGVQLNVDQPVRELGVGTQVMVEIGKSLFAKAKLVILDEPTAAMPPYEIQKLFAVIRSLKGQGVSFVYISHRLEEIFQIADRVTVLRDGNVVGTLETASTGMEELVHMMVGRHVGVVSAPRAACTQEAGEVLRVEGLRDNRLLKGISFSVRAGEVLGITGLLGAGKTETAMALFGARQTSGGRIWVKGREVRIVDPVSAISCGIGLVPEDRKTLGLIMQLSVKRNISLCNFHLVSRLQYFVDRSKEEHLAREFIDFLRIKAFPSQPVANLSGGNQQKVVLAKWLARKCSVLILDEPTRGVDVGAKEEIYKLISDLKSSGIGIVLMTSELPELLNLSDRILVLKDGAVNGSFDAGCTTGDKILLCAAGGAQA